MVEQMFLLPQVKQSMFINNKLVYRRVAPRVAAQLKTQDLKKSENIRKMSNLHRNID